MANPYSCSIHIIWTRHKEGRDNHLKIILDAGHGYETAGKRTPDGMREYEFNRVVANYAKKMLEEYENVQVYFTHSDERDVPLSERTDKANQLNVDIFVSIHANAYGSGGWNDVNGIETFVYVTKPKQSYEVAQIVQKELVNLTGRTNRGLKTANFHVLRETAMTAILCECGFMTNREEAELLKSDSYRKTCAQAIVNGLVEYYGLQKKPEPKPKGLWKVQVGAFSTKENADRLAKELENKGYPTYIVFE